MFNKMGVAESIGVVRLNPYVSIVCITFCGYNLSPDSPGTPLINS